MPEQIKKKTCDGVFDEGHIQSICSILVTSQVFSEWLTSSQAQIEFVTQLLDKHRGSSAGVKPSVKNVRAKAKEWKEMIEYTEECYQQLPEFCRIVEKRGFRRFSTIVGKSHAHRSPQDAGV